MNNVKTAFIVAHFHPNGKVADNTHALLEEMKKISKDIIFVSTNISGNEEILVKNKAKVIKRVNIGYDFWSYKIGIEALGDLIDYERIIICNTSFVCLDPILLLQKFTQEISEYSLVGVTKSNEKKEHLQSYFISFEGNEFLNSKDFEYWWLSMEPLNKRSENIDSYEVGMTQYFLQKNYKIKSMCELRPEHLLIMFARALNRGVIKTESNLDTEIVTLDLSHARNLNPTIYAWDFLMKSFGIIKMEQILYNYGHMYMDYEIGLLEKQKIYLIADAVEGLR
jgi:hypothetical protein